MLFAKFKLIVFSCFKSTCDAFRLEPVTNSLTPKPCAGLSLESFSWNLPTDPVDDLAIVAAVNSFKK